MYGYIYLVQNKINGKGYIGKHKYAGPGFDNNYWGSGVILKKAIEKYGLENFSRRVICTCDSLIELNESEKYWIKELNAYESDDWYNLTIGGDGFTGHHTEEAKQKIGDASRGREISDETRKKISERNTIFFKGYKWSEEAVEKRAASNRGKKRTQETKDNISKALTGKALSDEHKQKISKAHTGMKYSEERNKKISETMKGVPKSPEVGKKISASKMGHTVSEETRRKISETKRRKRATYES